MQLADGDPEKEKWLRKMDHYTFIHRILALNKKNEAEKAAAHAEPFGRKK